jgi:hypothetical protein
MTSIATTQITVAFTGFAADLFGADLPVVGFNVALACDTGSTGGNDMLVAVLACGGADEAAAVIPRTGGADDHAPLLAGADGIDAFGGLALVATTGGNALVDRIAPQTGTADVVAFSGWMAAATATVDLGASIAAMGCAR